MDFVREFVNKYGFPIVSTIGLSWFIYYIWKWVTEEVKPVVSEVMNILVDLIDRVRMLDNDLIRLNQKLDTFIKLRNKIK